MEWKEIIINREFHYHRISSLIILIFAIMTVELTMIIPFLIDFIPTQFAAAFKVVLLMLFESVLVLHWYYYRSVFPKSQKSSLVIAIVTENEKQKSRITNDFITHLKQQLSKYNLADSFNVIVLHNALSFRLKFIIENAFSQTLDKRERDRLIFDKALKKMNAKFVVYGNLLTRNSPNNTYTFCIEGLVNHKAIDLHKHKIMRKEFLDVWKKEIQFLEKEEISGFKSSSNHIFFASTYMIGLAAIVDMKYESGIRISNQLVKYIKEEPEYNQYERKVKDLQASSYLLRSNYLFHQGDFENATNTKREFLHLFPNTYDSNLNEAVYHISIRNDPKTALEFINKAENLSNGKGEWKYSKLYLLLRLKEFNEALKIIDNISNSEYKNEMITVNEVIQYNLNCLKRSPLNIESHFIIGILFYLKLGNTPCAHEKLEEFIIKIDGDPSWNILKERTNEYLSEINQKLGIK